MIPSALFFRLSLLFTIAVCPGILAAQYQLQSEPSRILPACLNLSSWYQIEKNEAVHVASSSLLLSNQGEESLVWQVSHMSEWLSVSPRAGITPQGREVELHLTYATHAFDFSGTYEAMITIETNDPRRPMVQVPVAYHFHAASN